MLPTESLDVLLRVIVIGIAMAQVKEYPLLGGGTFLSDARVDDLAAEIKMLVVVDELVKLVKEAVIVNEVTSECRDILTET